MTNAFEIRTERLRLHPVRRDEVDVLHAVFLDPVVRRFLLDDQEMSREWVEEVVAWSEARFAEQAHGLLAIRPADDDTLIGFTDFYEFHDPPQLELLYGLLPGWHGRGLASEAARAVLRWGFEDLGMERIQTTIDAPNQASLAVAARLGLREYRRAPGELCEQVFLEIRRARFATSP